MNILHIALLISFASLGFRAITGKGMILYFLRKPFDKMAKERSDYSARYARNIKTFDFLLYIMKPVILCSTCMASVHTLVWWQAMGIEWSYTDVPLVMLIVAFTNTFLWALVELFQAEAKKK